MTIFDKIKQGIDKGVTTASVKSREILDASKVKSQIVEFEKQKHGALTELGTSVCAMLDAGHVDEEALKTARAAIAGLDQQIKDKQDELARVHAEAQQALVGTKPVTTCVCGAALVDGAKFCASCGRAFGAAQ